MLSIKSTLSQKLKLIAAVLSLALIAVRPSLPEYRKSVVPAEQVETALYSDDTWGGQSTATWVDEGQLHWICRLMQSQFFPVCGFAISFSVDDNIPTEESARDFTRFDSLELTVHYRGEAPLLRIYLRNHNPAYSDTNDDDSYKFNAFSVSTEDLNQGATKIHLSEFAVADWWLSERNVPREYAAPEMSDIVAMGVDLPPPHVFGQHDIRIEKIDLVGEWIRAKTLYLMLALFWIAWAFIESTVFLLRRTKNATKPTSTES